MARLIPRKQIEEQQNITGSLTIGQDIFVGNDALISGSLFVSKSFFFGNDTGSRNEISGSVFLTGSLTIDGNLFVGAPETVLSITSSNTILAENTQRYSGILAKDFGANVPTLYVSSTDGDDNNDGRTIQYPLRTIKRAAQLASPGYDGRYGFDTGSIFNGYVIKVQAGTYLEDNPVILPANTTIWGAGLRITKINAKTPTEDLFHVNSGCYIAEVTMGGLRLFPDQINPEKGFAVAFQPGAFITTSPYTQNCSQISNQENSFTELYEEIPPGGGGLYVNGDVIHPDSPLASMVLDAYTQISPNGVGCLVNGRGFIQLVSFFTNFSYYAIRVNNGGHATLNNSNISFGLFGMYASGSRFISGSGGNIDARDRVRASWSVIVDVLNRGLSALPEVTKLNTDEGIRATLPSQYPQLYLSGSDISITPIQSTIDEVSADFKLVSEIVDKGPKNFPTLLAKSSNKGYGFNSPYNILGAQQFTSSIASASAWDLTQISSSFGALLGIFANGTGSYDFKANTSASIKVTDGTPTYPVIAISNQITSSVSSSFETIIDIIKNGISVTPKITSSNESAIKVGNIEQYTTGVSASLSTINLVSSSFSLIYNILDKGTGSVILPIPNDHRFNYTITNNDSSSYQWDTVGANPTITLYRGQTYRFFVNTSSTLGGINYPFFIRTKPVSGITDRFDYNKGVINNGDSVGNITFTVPFDAPNELYYVAQNTSAMSGKFHIINNSATPFNLIANTLTYPLVVSGSDEPSNDVGVINAYDILTENIPFIQEETIRFVSSSWSDFDYNESTCRRDIRFIVEAVANDLLFGGNEKSITAGRLYYEVPSSATTTQKDPTLTAVKYAAGMASNLLRNVTYVEPNNERQAAADSILSSREFVQNETITFLSSSWSNFLYNEQKCKRDVGYILDAVATDILYGGNERAVQAGQFYYLYPSLAIVRGDGDSEGQLGQTLDGIRFAAGVTTNIVAGKSFQTASIETVESYKLLRRNKSLIQNETIEFINVAFPQLKYSTETCRRDVGYIIDAISTDLLYGGIERSVTAGRYYYEYPSQATRTQRVETSGGIRYSKIISDFIVQNILLETPRVITNDERHVKVVSGSNNITSSFGGSILEQNSISSSFGIIEGIIKRGTSAIPSILAKNSDLNWNVSLPLNVSTTNQITNSFITPDEVIKLGNGFDVVTGILINGGVEPNLTSSLEAQIKVTDNEQITGSVSNPYALTSPISASFGYVVDIISGGLNRIHPIVSNINELIKVTDSIQSTSNLVGTNSETASISSSFGAVINIINNGITVLPTLIENTNGNIKVTDSEQFVSASYSGSLEDIAFVSQSISKVTQIVESGNVDLFGKTNYSAFIPNRVGVYEILKQNIPFIQNETIAYLSSSWAGFQYDEVKCKRDIGLIISGAAEDLLFGANSASIVNGQFYYEYPSQATVGNDGDTGGQLNQTLDGINYASRLAQKVIQNVVFNLPTTEVSASNALLVNNKEFIQNETIAYLSSSWGGFDYNEATCKRDVGYIIDAVRTDLVYGGNERSRQAGLYYFLYPSQATGSQLLQTTDGIKYASNLSQKIVSGSIFQSADSDKLEASRLMSLNKGLIAAEVVEYVSSSWSEVFYNEDKCKRDVGYIIDAVRTDLVYGGNERTSIAGEFYYRFPSSATVGGVPSTTAQLDPTTTGIEYASRLGQNIIQNKILVNPSTEVLEAAKLVRNNRTFLQQNVIEFISENYPNLNYLVDKCFRDVGFIVDGAVTDLVYGGNERSINSGRFYFKFANKATDIQLTETIAGINFAKDLAKLVAIGGKAVEDGFDNVADIIASGSTVAPTLVSNTFEGIKATNINQITSSNFVTISDKAIVSSSFANVINIIGNGTGSIPTIVSSSFNGILVGTDSQFTTSFTPEIIETSKVGSGFDIIIDIVGNGLNAKPTLVTNTIDYIKRTNTQQFVSTASIAQAFINNSNTAFNDVLDIVQYGTGSTPTLIKNTNSLVKISDSIQYSASMAVSSSRINTITGSFDTIIRILNNGTGSLPTIIDNTNSNIKVTNTLQFVSASGTQTQSTLISQSVSVVTDIIANGTGSIITYLSTSSYSSPSADESVWKAYNILKANIQFIQDETIAYLSSSWSTASYDEEKCRRDVGLIISGAAEDLIFNSNSASLVNGKFYYEYPSQAQGAQLNQTLDGVFYASKLAQKIVKGDIFSYPTSQSIVAYDLLVNNKELIQNETIAYISSSWSTHLYSESICRRDVGYIIDSVATDVKWGGNERSIKAGLFYYLYPSEATGSQIEETVTGITYARNLSDRLLRNLPLQKVSQNKLQAKQLIFNNKGFIQNEVIEYVSASWNGFLYNEETCKRDVGFILDAVITDVVYGGNERSIEAGTYYYLYPSEATTTQLGPTLSGIRHAKGMVEQVLKNNAFVTASLSRQTAYNLLLNNKELIQNETIEFVNSAWSFFDYNEAKCRRDVGYIIDAVATDILYGGNERSIEAGEYYYLYPSLATVDGDGDSAGQLGQTLDGIKYSKGISQKIVSNTLLKTPTTSSLTAWTLLRENKPLIQAETIAYLSSSWTGVDGFYYNEASCSRDVAYIVDNVATDILYGGNERSSKAGEYYYLYPSKAIVGGVPSQNAQLEQTIQGVRFAAGVAQNIIANKVLTLPTEFVSSSVELMRKNRTFIQNETIQFIDAFYPFLKYNREKCRRDVGYIVDNISTDLWYGGNERSIIAGDYYYRYPSLATKQEQVVETVAGVNYAKAVAKAVVQNIKLSSPELGLNTDKNIKVGSINQYTSSISAGIDEVSKISSSFAIVTDIIEGGLSSLPIIVSNNEGLVTVTNENTITSASSATSVEIGIVTASFGLIRDIIYWGSASLPDSLVNNFQYGFELETPTLWNISSYTQSLGSGVYNEQTASISSSFGSIIDIINNGTGSIPTLEANTSASIKVSTLDTFKSTISGSEYQKNRIGNLFGLVMNVIEGGRSSIPRLVPNLSSSIKVTQTPQIISGSGADRLQSRLVSSSFGLVIDVLLNGTGSQILISGSENANTNPKITSAYNLLLDNQQMIIDETISYMSSSWSTFDYNQPKCERDLGLIISGAAFDLLYGGNSASLVNGKFYLEYPSQANDSQLDQTITAIRYAGGIAERVVRNTILQHISSSVETSASYASLINNKSFIQSESILYVSSSWEGFEYNEASCSRDIGYIVDAVATDLLYGGNERSIVAGRYYYDFPSQATSTQLEPTLTGVRYAKGTSMNVVVNKQFFTPDSDTQTAYNLIKDNKEFIQEETVAFVNAKWPYLNYIESKCKRDVGFIVDAVATDLLYGGNERSNKAGEFYYLYPSLAITSAQKSETTQAVDYARRLTEQIINSELIPTPQIIPNGVTPSTDINVIATHDLLLVNKPFIQAETIAYVSSSWVGFLYNEASCSRDVGFLIDAVATDVLYGGNESSAYAGLVYFETASAATGLQLEPTVDAIDYAAGLASRVIQNVSFVTASQIVSASVELIRNNREFIQEETMQYLTASWSNFEYDKIKCRRDVGHIVDATATDLLYGGNERSVVSGEFYYRYPSKATLLGDGDDVGQLRQTIDGINYASRVAQKVAQNIEYITASLEASASFDLLRKNKSFIANEVIEYVSSSWSSVKYNEDKCKRDVGYLIDAAATDTLYGGQERSVIAGTFYYLFPSRATNAGVPSEQNQLDPTLTGIRYAGRLAKKVILNPTFVEPSGSSIGGSRLLQLNKSLIQKETITFLSSSWSTLQYNEASCSRDVGFIIDAIRTDLVYGGNERSIEAGSYYYFIPSVAIKESYTDNGQVGQKKQTVDGINFARGISEKIVAQTQLVRPGQRRIEATTRLRNAKEELKQRAIGYTNGAFPYLVYNEASCSRDTGLIVDACCTDLFYGGNERGIAAASSYYNGQYGSAEAVITAQKIETLETNRYLRTRAEFIAAGAPVEAFGSLIVATGIDYSYNGSGVTFKALPPNQGGSGVANPAFEITELGGGRIFFTSGNQDGDFRIGTGLSINQATGTLVGRTFSKSLFSLVTPFSLALQI